MKRLALLLVLLAPPAAGHSWYPWECCSDQDCAPIAGVVTELREGYRLPDGLVVPHGDPRIRSSHDAEFHWCRRPDGALICLFVPVAS